MPFPNTLLTLWKPSIPLAAPSSKLNRGFPGSCIRCFHFLIRLAWESRFRLPILYILLSFLCDVHMRMEVTMYRDHRIILADNEAEDLEDDGVSEDEVSNDQSNFSEDLNANDHESLNEEIFP